LTVENLDVSGCKSLRSLPNSLRVERLDLADSGIGSLPTSIKGARLLWRGVPINRRIAFRPETITATEILAESNAELRRVLLERMGYEAFLNQAKAETLDRDRDPGGERRLLRVPMEGDEDLVCVSVICPSTGRRYVIRVPPAMRSCRQAVAWIAGFDDPDDYRPSVET
jgi:Leucine-rich repeat (LRR) protein